MLATHSFLSNTFEPPTGAAEGKFHTDATGLRCFICTFTNSSSTTTFNVMHNTLVDYLVVAGGGAGGSGSGAGGGGAGGVLMGTQYPMPKGTYTITIGTGGVASTASASAGAVAGHSIINNGSADIFKAIGGGRGGHEDGTLRNGAAGGSGGGGGRQGGTSGTGGAHTDTGAVDTHGTVAATHIGFAGASAGGNYYGGGGGGAGEAGTTGSSITSGGDGGDGINNVWSLGTAETKAMFEIFDNSVGELNGGTRWIAGGGGGHRQGGNHTNNAPSGKGGGGLGGFYHTGHTSYPLSKGTDGTVNTGGGGGGSHNSYGGINNGGSGIVVLRFIVDKVIT